MPKIDDKELARTHVIVVTMADGSVRREGPVPEVVAKAQAAAYRNQGKVRSATVQAFAPARLKGKVK